MGRKSTVEQLGQWFQVKPRERAAKAESTLLSGDEDQMPQGGSGLHGRANGGAEGLKRASGGRAKGMDSSGGACRQAKLGEEAGLVKDRAGGNKEHSTKSLASTLILLLL